MSEYVYDPSMMNALYKMLNDEDSDYGYGATWKTRFKWDPIARKGLHIEDETHDTFEIDGIDFWWYHAKNKDAKHPVLVASWNEHRAMDDIIEHEREIDADIESIIDLVRSVNSGSVYEPDIID